MVRLDAETEARLDRLAKATGRSKSHYAKEAIKAFLNEREDYLLAISRLEDKSDTIVGADEVWRRLGLET